MLADLPEPLAGPHLKPAGIGALEEEQCAIGRVADSAPNLAA